MYEWIGEINKLVQSVRGKTNNEETRLEVSSAIVDILNDHEVAAYFDCGPNVNTKAVVDHGEFHAMVRTYNMEIKFICNKDTMV